MFRKRYPCVSLRTLKLHEFHSTLRYIRHAGATWPDIYLRLGEIQKDSIARLIKGLGGIYLGYLVLNSFKDGQDVTVTISTISAQIPAVLIVFLISLQFFVVVLQLQNVFSIITLRAQESTKLRLRNFSANAFGLYHGQDELALAIPIPAYGVLSEKLATSKFLIRFMGFVFALCLAPMAMALAFYLKLSFSLLVESIRFWESLCAVASILVLVGSAGYLFLFNIPLPLQKNTKHIRWGLLDKLHSPNFHPRIDEWLADEDN